MLQRPLYQTAIALLTLAALAGAVFFVVSPGEPPGIEITLPPTATPVGEVPAEEPRAAASDGLININTASAADLAAALPGIGPVLSERIVEYRQANGPFARTDQLMGVQGIGAATYERVRDIVTIGE